MAPLIKSKGINIGVGRWWWVVCDGRWNDWLMMVCGVTV